MRKFLEEIIVESLREENYPEHQVGKIGIYNGKDGLKYYVILERHETDEAVNDKWWYETYKPEVDTSKFKSVRLVAAMVSNPDLEVGARTLKRDFPHPSYLKIIDVDNWMEAHGNFLSAMIQAGEERLAKHK